MGGDIRRIGGEMEWAKEEVHAKVSRTKDSTDSHDKGSHVRANILLWKAFISIF